MNFLIFWSIAGLFELGCTYEKHESRIHAHHFSRLHFKHENTTLSTQPPLVSSKLENYAGFNLMFNSEEKMIGFSNTTSKEGLAGLLIREGGPEILLVDSKSGTVLRFQNAREGTKIVNKDLQCDISEAFHTIFTKYEYLNQTISGTTTGIEGSSEETLGVLNRIYSHLGHPKDADQPKMKSFLFITRFFKLLKRTFLGPLKGLLEGKGRIPLKENLNRFLTITTGLTKLFTKAVGGLKGILKAGVRFELNSVYNNKNGAEVFVYIIRQTGAKLDLSLIWRNLLNNIEELLQIIELLGGGESKNGVDETFGVIGHIWAALSFKLPISSLVKYLFQESSEDKWDNSDSDFSDIVKDIKNITDEQTRRYDNTKLISPFVTFFTNLTGNTLIHEGVNVSELVEKWRKRDVIGGFMFITQTVMKFGGPEKYTSILFHSFTAFLNSTSDPQALRRLIPQVSLGDFSGQNGSLWQQISKLYNVDSLLKQGQNPNDLLSNISAFGEFSKVFQGQFGKSFDFAKVLNGSTVSDYLSKNLLKQPVKWTNDIIHDSTNFIKHIFWDPIVNWIPGAGGSFNKIPWFTQSPILPVVPIETETTTKNKCEEDCDENSSTAAPEKTIKTPVEEGDIVSDPYTTKETEEDCEDGETQTTSSKTSTQKLTTRKIESEAVDDDDSTKKPCIDDCDKKSTTATTLLEKTTERDIEFKNHHSRAHRIHHENKYGHKKYDGISDHHQSRKHDSEKHGVKGTHDSRNHKLRFNHQNLERSHHTNGHDNRMYGDVKGFKEEHNFHHETKLLSRTHHAEGRQHNKHEAKYLKKKFES